jgi:hypothetical protein
MAWLREEFRYQVPISVPVTSVTSPRDVSITLPKGLDDFWNNVDDAGAEIRVTTSDGETAQSYGLASFNKATRTGTLGLQAADLGGATDRLALFWLYFGTTTPLGSGATVFTPSSSETGYIELGAPSTYIVTLTPPQAGATAPKRAFQKGAAEEVFVWLAVSGLLEQPRAPYRGRFRLEEPGVTQVQVLNTTSGSSVEPSMTVPADLRWVSVPRPGGRSELFLRMRLKGGSDGDRYVIEGKFTTSKPGVSATYRNLAPRVGFRVIDLTE